MIATNGPLVCPCVFTCMYFKRNNIRTILTHISYRVRNQVPDGLSSESKTSRNHMHRQYNTAVQQQQGDGRSSRCLSCLQLGLGGKEIVCPCMCVVLSRVQPDHVFASWAKSNTCRPTPGCVHAVVIYLASVFPISSFLHPRISRQPHSERKPFSVCNTSSTRLSLLL